MPRTFRLYEELEKAEHAKLSDQSVSYGLNEGDDKSFTNCNVFTIESIIATTFSNPNLPWHRKHFENEMHLNDTFYDSLCTVRSSCIPLCHLHKACP